MKLITSDLYTSDEIGYHDAYNIIGLFAKDKGTTAFTNKKYKRRISERRKEETKFLVQTLIPILALIVAILSLSIKFENIKTETFKELKQLKTVIQEQEKRLNSLERNSKNTPPDSNNLRHSVTKGKD